MPKHTNVQAQEIKSLVTQAMVRRLTPGETQAYIQRIMKLSISQDRINHIRSELKHDSIAAIDRLRKDEYAFVQVCFWNRIDEWNEMQRTLYEVIANENSKPHDKRDNTAIIHAVNSLSDISDKLLQAYSNLSGLIRIPCSPFAFERLRRHDDDAEAAEAKISKPELLF